MYDNTPQKPSVYIDERKVLLQDCVWHLEAYKRRLGRTFDKVSNKSDRLYFLTRYNDVENTIERMCDMYNIVRVHRPHKLKLEDL